MKKILFFNIIQDKAWKNRALFLMLALVMSIGNAWGHDTHYGKAVLQNATGHGTVYLSTASGSNSGQTSSSNPGTEGGTSWITWNCGESSDNDSKTYYARYSAAEDGWYYAGWSDNSSATSYTASTTGKQFTKASSTSQNNPTTSTIYGFFKPVTVTGAPDNVNINATDPLATYPDAGGVVLSFATANSNKIGDFTTGASGNARWNISAWTRVSASSATFNYKFVGDGSYGETDRTFTKTVTLTSKGDASSTRSCTLTAKYPNPKVITCDEAATYLAIYPIFKATDDEAANIKETTAVFDVKYADNGNNFTATFSNATGGGEWILTGISVDQAKQKATVSYTFSGKKIIGTHTAQLTLTANDCKGWDDAEAPGGQSVTIALTAYNEQEAVNEVSVTTAGGVTTEYATWADGFAAANANAGCTLTLLRNIDLGTITATNNITKAMTIDLNGKELRAAVNATSVGILTITAAVPVTIKDSKTGGKIINEIARNSEIRTIFVNKAGATLTLESGTIAVNNLGQYASAAATVNGVAVAKYASCTARAIHQIAGTTVNIKGGKLEAKGTRSVYGIVQTSSAATNEAGTTVLNVTGGEIAVEAPYNAFGIHAYGKVNMSAGVINTHITTDMVDACYAADHANNTKNGSGYGIQMKVSVSATASSCYYGTLNMTGGTINVISDRTKAEALYNYGIYLEGAATGVGAGKTAADGTLSQKACAKGSIENATINVHSNTYYSYGIIVYGSYNSYDNEYFTVPIKNCNIDVQAYLYTYAICANAAVNSTYGGCYWGDVELTGNTVAAESVTAHTAYAVYVLAATAHIFKDANTTTAPIYYGEYATAAKAVINSGTYTAKAKTTTAYAVCSSTRAKTVYDSETKVEANRKLGGNAEAYPTVIIHGGTFRGEATTTTSRAVSTGGYTTINGGTFEAYSGTTTAYGLCCVSGTMKATNAVVTASATGTAYGAYASCGIPDNTTAQTGFAYAGDMTLTNCTITATTRTSTEARGVCVHATSKLHTFAQFVTDSTTRKWSAATAAAYRAIYPCTVQGRDSVGIAIAAKATINGCDIKATAATTTAYGVYGLATSFPLSLDSIASPEMTITNTKIDVKTNGTTTAYGVYSGGKSEIKGCTITVAPKTTTGYGVYALSHDKTTSVEDTKITVTTTASAYGIYGYADINATSGLCQYGTFELKGNNNVLAQTTSGNSAYALYLSATKRAITTTGGAYRPGDYVSVGKATIDGGEYKAIASGTTAYAVHSAAKQTQGEKENAPSITINDGKFWAEASSTYADISSACVPGYCVIKGGYYKNDANIDTRLEEGYNKFALKTNTQEYSEGYRWRVTNDFKGEVICKVTHGSTTKEYDQLESAFKYVNDTMAANTAATIVLCANYTLSAGNYTIPSGVTLLVPYDGTYTSLTKAQTESSYNAIPSCYRKLTMSNGAHIIVEGDAKLEVGGVLNTGGQTNTAIGAPRAHGKIRMANGSSITLNNGSHLYCWGYIVGAEDNSEGTILAKEGSTVHEGLQIRDWKGGKASLPMQDNSNRVFPIHQYYLQNIETPITFEYGSNDLITTGMRVSILGSEVEGRTDDQTFISSTGGLFNFKSSDAILVRDYDEKNDRIIYNISGSSFSFDKLNLNLKAIGMGVNIESENYVLPITNNMTLHIKAREFNVGAEVFIAPGAELYIEEGSNVICNKNVYVLDKDDWVPYQGVNIFPLQYANETDYRSKPIRTWEDMQDAKICVNGTIQINQNLYTSNGKANICSTGKGVIVYKGSSPQANSTMYMVANATNDGAVQDSDYKEVAVTAAYLHNDETRHSDPDNYTQTTGAVAGDEFWYVESLGKWVKNEFGPELDIVDADGTNLTINANGWASTGWPYTVDSVKYEKVDREDDRTLIIPYNGTAGDLLPIAVLDSAGNPICRHIYKVPFVYTGTEEMIDMKENSIVFVKSDTLRIEGTASAKEIYVAPGAALQVNGILKVEKLVLRTTPFDAAILTNNGTINGNVYYSRIARDTDFHLFAIPAGSNTADVVLSDGTSAAVASTVAPYGNAWQLREYNTARRAEEGDDGANWNNIGVNADKITYSDVDIKASKGYELRSGSKYYREYLFPVTLPTTATSVQVTDTTSEAGAAAGAAHAGWNILCSPYTGIYTVEYEDNATGIKVSWQKQELDGSYSYIQEQPTQIKPAVPFAYQASQTGTLAFDTNFTFAASAPRKQSAAEALTETEWIHLDIFDAYGEGDETSLFVHPTRFEQTYKTGIDVAKQSLTAARPIIYSTHAYGDMAFAGVADSLLENGIDIAVYSPAEQKLTFSLRENKFLNRLEYLWLADNETGARTDLLMDDYTCRADAGTIKGRFVLNGRFKAPQISTGIGNTQTDYNIYAIGNNIAISGVEQGTPIYVFDAVGHMIYTTAATSDEVIVPAPCAGVYMLSVGGQTAKLVVNQ